MISLEGRKRRRSEVELDNLSLDRTTRLMIDGIHSKDLSESREELLEAKEQLLKSQEQLLKSKDELAFVRGQVSEFLLVIEICSYLILLLG